MKKALCCLLAFVIIYYTQAQSPTITSNAPTSGTVDATVTITGTGFNSTPADNEVFFGATRATVSAATGTSLIISGEKGQKFPAALIENYLNQGKNIIFKTEGDIYFNASIKKKSAANTASLQIVSTNKGKIIFDKHAAIISEKGELAVLLQTKGSIIIDKTAKISTNGGDIRLQAFEQKVRFSKELTNSIAISGKLNASSNTKGGNIIVESDVIYIYQSAKLYAKGNNGGGNILVGGDWQGGTVANKKFEETIYEAATVTMDKGAIIDASATENGNGGKVVLWSKLNHPASYTQAQGQLLAIGKGNSGKGGLIETSGGGINFDGVAVSTIASNGTAGEWLLDPHNLYFSTSDLNTIATNLASNNITITTSTNTNTGAGASNNIFGRGHIVFRDNLTYTGSNARTLTLTADQDIWINNNITSTNGALSLNFNAGNRILLDAGINTSGGAVAFNNNAKVHFQQTSGTQNLNTNGGNLAFNSADIFLLQHSGSLAVNTAGGELNLGTGTIQQSNTYNQIDNISVLLNSWQGAHAAGSKTYGINIVAGREYTTRMYFWDSWDGGEQGQLFVRRPNNVIDYYFQGERAVNGNFTLALASNGAQFSASGVSHMGRNSGWQDQFVDVTFVAVANGVLETWTNLNEPVDNESLELNNFYETQFPSFLSSSGSRSLSLNTTTGQIVGDTKNVFALASLTVSTNNDNGFMNGVISGATNFIKDGTGRVAHSGTNTYTGTTTVNAGTLRFVPNSNNTTTLTGNFVNNGAVTYEGGMVNNRGTIFLDGAISGSGTWNVSNGVATSQFDNNRLSLRGTNTTSGQITVGQFGNFWLEGANVNSTSNIALNTATSQLRLYGPANATISVGAVTGIGTVDFAHGGGGTALTFSTNTGATNVQFDGVFRNSGTLNGPTTLSLRKQGTGTFTLTENNLYSGNTTINAGTLVLQNNAPNPTNKTFNGPGALRIESTGTAFTGAFSTSGWSFGATLSSLTLGKTTNTQNVTFGGATTIAGPITTYGGSILVNENLNTIAGNAGGDILLKASADITLAANKSVTTSGGDVIFWSNSDAGQSNGSISLRNTSSITTGSNTVAGGNVWIGGGADGATWNGISVGNGYAVPGTSFTPSNGGTAISAGIYLEKTAISTFGGHIKLAGDASTSGFGIVTYGANTLNALTGSIDFEGNASNISSTNSVGLLFGMHDISIAANTTLSTSGAGTAIKLTGFGRGSGDAIGVSGLLQLNSSGTGAIELYGTAHGTGRSIVAGNYYHGIINAYSASGIISLNGGSKGIFVASAVLPGATSGPSRINLGKGGTIISSTSNVVLTGDIIALGASGIGVETTGTATVEPFTNSFTSALTFPANLTLANTVSGLTLGKPTNTANITFGSATNIAGPITAFGGEITIGSGANLTTTTANNINLFASNGFTTAGTTRTTINSNGGNILVTADADANNTGILNLDYLTLDAGIGNLTIEGATMSWDVSTNTYPILKGTGALTIQPTAASFGQVVDLQWFALEGVKSSLTIGKGNNVSNVTINDCTTCASTSDNFTGKTLAVAGPITAFGSTLSINSALTATNSNITLTATTAITQTGAITANGLALIGAGTATLTNASNSINTIAGGTSGSRIGAVNYNNNKALTVGTVGTAGIFSTGAIELATSSGDVLLTEPINSTLVSGDAVKLFADKDALAGAVGDGNIKFSGNGAVTIASGARALFYSGIEAASTGLTTVIGSSANYRYNIADNTVLGNIIPAIAATGRFGLLRAIANADLSALAVSVGTLSPTFAAATIAYTASVSNATTSITVTPTRSDINATITVNGSAVTSGSASGAINLTVGANTITTVVTAQNGTTTKTFTVTVNRAGSANADLSALTLSEGTLSPTFAAATTAYTASVSNPTTSITVTPAVAQANAIIQVNVNSGAYATVISGNVSNALALNDGTNTIIVKVTAQDGTTLKEYNINVTRLSILPVTLVNYAAKLNTNGAVELNWLTASETNNSHFEVLRSADGINFTTIGKLTGAGNTTQEKRYNFTDLSPLAGNNYYELLQYDKDGKKKALGIRLVKVSQIAGGLTIYPNPSNGIVNLRFEANSYQKVELIDLAGKILMTRVIGRQETTIVFNLSNLAAGIYNVRLTGNDKLAIKQIIKE